MESEVRKTLREVIEAVTPILVMVALLLILVVDVPLSLLLDFMVGGVLTVAGIVLFLLGVKMGMLPMGEAIGAELPKRQSVLFIIIVVFLLSFLVTIAEPDVRVLTSVFSSVAGDDVDKTMMILVIAFGVGFFMVLSVIRMVAGVPMKYLLTASYLTIILLSFFVPSEYLAVSFDAGGVTTGPITVPVILALGIGVVSVLGGKSPLSEGFGLIGIASVGPILGMMIMGVLIG